MQYTCKSGINVKEKTFILDDDQLTVFSQGEISKTIPYSEIRRIQLSHEPSKHSWKDYICRITLRYGDELVLSNKLFYGIFKIKDKSDEYNRFINELHKILSKKKLSVEYLGGQWSKAYYIVVMIGILFWLGIAFVLIRYGRYAVLLGLMIPIAWLLWFIWTLIKNRPVKYNPLDIPSRLLPK